MPSTTRPNSKNARTPFRSFQYACREKWAMPRMHEVQDLTRHQPGIILLAFFLLLNYSFASVIISMPVAAVSDSSILNWNMARTMSPRLDREYHTEVPPLVAAYLTSRGAFAVRLAQGNATAEEATAWKFIVQQTKKKLLDYTVPATLKEVHLGLVVSVGLDEMAVERVWDILAQGGDQAEAQAIFAEAEDRLIMVLQSAPWLTRSP